MKVLGLINDRIKYYEHCEESSEDIKEMKVLGLINDGVED